MDQNATLNEVDQTSTKKKLYYYTEDGKHFILVKNHIAHVAKKMFYLLFSYYGSVDFNPPGFTGNAECFDINFFHVSNKRMASDK